MNFTIYEVHRNTDLTEGKGRMVAVSWWSTPEAAAKDAVGRGVMGVGDGEVVEVRYELTENRRYIRHEKKIYGYRKHPNGKWDHGFLDFRDLYEDPEWEEYQRLSEKFSGAMP